MITNEQRKFFEDLVNNENKLLNLIELSNNIEINENTVILNYGKEIEGLNNIKITIDWNIKTVVSKAIKIKYNLQNKIAKELQ